MASSAALTGTFENLLLDVDSLLALHPSKGTRGRPAGDTGPLLRSAVVLLHTAWENYVEQVSLEAFAFVLDTISGDDTKLPKEMRSRLGAAKNPWSLAGDRWRTQAREALERDVAKLNTPNVNNVEELLRLATGDANALQGISWKGMGNAKLRDQIDEFVQELRGEIVHKGTTPGSLNLGDLPRWVNFFRKVAQKLDQRIALKVELLCGASPW